MADPAGLQPDEYLSLPRLRQVHLGDVERLSEFLEHRGADSHGPQLLSPVTVPCPTLRPGSASWACRPGALHHPHRSARASQQLADRAVGGAEASADLLVAARNI